MLAWVWVIAVFAAAGVAGVRASKLGIRAAALPAGVALGLVLLGAIVFRADLPMQKLISYLIMPAGLLWIGLGGLALHLLVRGPKSAGGVALALFAFYSFCANPWVANALMRVHERSVESFGLADAPRLDAVLVLGGGAAFAGENTAELSDYGDRVMLGARLYFSGKAPILITSGSSIPGLHEAQDLSEATTAIWRDLQIPEAAILRLPEPKNTSQEIAALAELAAERGWQRVGVLSSAFHLPRIMKLCERQGLRAVPLAADHRSSESRWHPAFLVPQPTAWRTNQLVFWENVGRLVGR